MITLNQKQKIIIAYHNNQKSQRAIARELSLNRRTVARYIKDYDRKRIQLLTDNNHPAKEELIADIIQKPSYDISSRKKVKLTAEIIDRIQMAVFSPTWSDYRHGELYAHQKSESFLDAHASFFETIGGVYQEIVYDNARVMVARFVGKSITDFVSVSPIPTRPTKKVMWNALWNT
jgi:transposase-like protein